MNEGVNPDVMRLANDQKALTELTVTEAVYDSGQENTRELLQTTITAAHENKESVTVSEEGKDVEITKKWVTEEVMTAYAVAIADAEKVLDDEGATQEEVEAAVTALEEATIIFNAAKQDGSKVEEKLTIKEQLERNFAYIVNTVDNPTYGTLGGEWSILSLARGDYAVPEGYYDTYYTNVEDKVASLMERYKGKLDRSKGTEHSRVILGLTSIGKDITDVAGYDLRDGLADFNFVKTQGINGPIFALIALDTKNYEIPIIEGVAEQTTREKLIDYILAREINGGGWSLQGTAGSTDPDITAMAIQGLTPYYESNSQVKAAVDRGIVWLSSVQKEENGGYASWGSLNSESCAQVIVALTGLGIDPHTDPQFIKNGRSVVDALMSFALPEGGFMHVYAGADTGGGGEGGVANGMATDQGTYALVAYDRFVEGKNPLYNMTDVAGKDIQESEAPTITTDLKDMITKADKITFDLWARDADGKKINVSNIQVTNNEKPVSVTWDDLEKTSYTLNLEIGINHVKINVNYNGKNYLYEYTLIRQEAEDGDVIGTFTFTMEAFTIGLGHLIEPIQVNVHKGRTAAQELLEILDDQGYKYEHTGTPQSNFYLARLYDGNNTIYKTTPKIPEVLKEKLTENGLPYKETGYWDGSLGEFDFNHASGWMYAVNNVFPNVGFADKYLQDGDVMRVQFTLAYGADIGGASAMGWGNENDYFPVVNRDRLTKKIAEINSSKERETYLSDPKINEAYNNGLKILQKIDVSQQELNDALNSLIEAMELPPEEVDKTILQTAIISANENKASVTVSEDGKDVGPTEKWVTAAVKKAYEAAIEGVQAVLDDENATQAEVDAALRALETATASFNEAKKYGTKVEEPEVEEILLPENNNKPKIAIPENNKSYKIPVKESDQEKEISIDIPKGQKGKVFVELPANTGLPQIETSKGNVSVVIPKGTKMTRDAATAIELITTKDPDESTRKAKVNSLIPTGKKLDKILIAFSVGENEKVEFSDFVTINFAGGKGKQVAYVQNGQIYSIQKYASDQEGLSSKKEEYAFDSGNDLIVKTKHFTEYILYSITTETSGGGSSSGGGGGGSTSTSTTTVKATQSATVKGQGVSIDFPANTMNSDFEIKIEKVTGTSRLPMASNSKFAGDVFEITKNKEENFKKAVTLTVPFDKSKVDFDKYDISLFWLDEGKKQWIELDNIKVDQSNGKVKGEADYLGKFAVLAVEKEKEAEEAVEVINEVEEAAEKSVETFNDVIGHWAAAHINKMVEIGAISGYADGTFKPNNNITRAEFATALVKALGLEVKSGKVFADTENHWAKDYISTAYANGILSGYDETTFGTNDFITREQMAVMVVKAASLENTTVQNKFADDRDISSWAKEAVNTAGNNGIINGYPDNTFKPQNNATRAEAVTAIVKIIQ